MPVKIYKPTSPGRRGMSGYDFEEITKTEPEKSLLKPLKKSGGRNVYGRITTRYRGGGHKRMYRLIDFKRDKIDEQAVVLAIEYDPNRTSRIALIQYPNGTKSYILAPLELRPGHKVISTYDKEIEFRPGNCLPLRRIPLGTAVHNMNIMYGFEEYTGLSSSSPSP